MLPHRECSSSTTNIPPPCNALPWSSAYRCDVFRLLLLSFLLLTILPTALLSPVNLLLKTCPSRKHTRSSQYYGYAPHTDAC